MLVNKTTLYTYNVLVSWVQTSPKHTITYLKVLYVLYRFTRCNKLIIFQFYRQPEQTANTISLNMLIQLNPFPLLHSSRRLNTDSKHFIP